MNHALLIVGHGSRDPEGIAEFLSLTSLFRQRRPDQLVEIAFLEFARPTIQEGIDRLVENGALQIVVVPGILMAAGHAKNDIASEVQQARNRHADREILMGRTLDIDPKLLELCRLRFRESFAPDDPPDPHETLLLVVGRGSSDPDANGNLAKVTRFLHEGYSVGWSAYCFSGIAQPLLENALSTCKHLPFRTIVVQPYFLFTGVLLKRIYDHVQSLREARPGWDLRATPHLQAHPLLLDALEARAHEAIHGSPNMNCSLCRYRVHIIGHEHAYGEPQQPHHHHVQGIHTHVHHRAATHPLAADGLDSNETHIWENNLTHQLRF